VQTSRTQRLALERMDAEDFHQYIDKREAAARTIGRHFLSMKDKQAARARQMNRQQVLMQCNKYLLSALSIHGQRL
jgi:vacuolar-type H+-ATPase subunit E/Vma4